MDADFLEMRAAFDSAARLLGELPEELGPDCSCTGDLVCHRCDVKRYNAMVKKEGARILAEYEASKAAP